MSLITSCQKRIASKLARRLRGSSRSANTASALVQPSSVLPGFHKPVRCGRRDQRLAAPHARAYARRGASPGHQTPIPSEAVRNFGFQIDQPDSPPNQRFQQFKWMMVQEAARVGEAWNSIEWSHRTSLCQIQVKAGIELRIPLQNIDGRFKSSTVDDQACCRHNSVSMRLLDGLIDPSRK